MLCGARNRSGGRCRQHVAVGRKRCRNHGGLSTGARVHRARPQLLAARARWVEREHAAGRKARTGFAVTPLSVIRARAAESDVERWVRMTEELMDLIPAAPADRPVEKWTAAELLSETARLGLLRVHELLSKPREDDDIKWVKLQTERGVQVARLYANVQIAGLQAREDQGIDRVRAAVAAFRGEGGDKGRGAP